MIYASAGETTTKFLESLPFSPHAIEVVAPGMNTTVQARTRNLCKFFALCSKQGSHEAVILPAAGLSVLHFIVHLLPTWNLCFSACKYADLRYSI